MPLGGCQRVIGSRAGEESQVLVHDATRYGKLLHLLDQVRTTACPRNLHIAGGKGGVLIYVRMNTSYNQTISRGSLQKATAVMAQVQLATDFQDGSPEHSSPRASPCEPGTLCDCWSQAHEASLGEKS